jgi:hypothetical protein
VLEVSDPNSFPGPKYEMNDPNRRTARLQPVSPEGVTILACESVLPIDRVSDLETRGGSQGVFPSGGARRVSYQFADLLHDLKRKAANGGFANQRCDKF